MLSIVFLSRGMQSLLYARSRRCTIMGRTTGVCCKPNLASLGRNSAHLGSSVTYCESRAARVSRRSNGACVWMQLLLIAHTGRVHKSRTFSSLSSESGFTFATSEARAYTLTMHFSCRGFGSSRCERDSKTLISAALTSGWLRLSPSNQTSEPGSNSLMRLSGAGGLDPTLSRARSKGNFPACAMGRV